MQASLYAGRQGKRVLAGNMHVGVTHVCGRQQSTVDRTNLEDQPAKRLELGRCLLSQIATCASTTKAKSGKIGRVVYLFEAKKSKSIF